MCQISFVRIKQYVVHTSNTYSHPFFTCVYYTLKNELCCDSMQGSFCPMKWTRDIFQKYDWFNIVNSAFSVSERHRYKKGGFLSFQPITLPKYIFTSSHWITICAAFRESQLHYYKYHEVPLHTLVLRAAGPPLPLSLSLFFLSARASAFPHSSRRTN